MFGFTLDLINSVDVELAFFPDLFQLRFLGSPQGRPAHHRREPLFQTIFEILIVVTRYQPSAHAHNAESSRKLSVCEISV